MAMQIQQSFNQIKPSRKRNFLWYHPGIHEWCITHTASGEDLDYGWQFLGELR
jgi:hypothetical protein